MKIVRISRRIEVVKLLLILIVLLQFILLMPVIKLNLNSSCTFCLPKDCLSSTMSLFSKVKGQKFPALGDTVRRRSINSSSKYSTPLFQKYLSAGETGNHICRLHAACLKSDGTIIVENKLRLKQTELLDCGITKISFMDGNEMNRPEWPFITRDIFGPEAVRWHIPLFMRDMLAYISAYAILDSYRLDSNIKSYCTWRDGKSCQAEKFPRSFSPGIFFEDRIISMENSTWVKSFIPLVSGAPEIMFFRDKFSKFDTNCFNSIIAYSKRSFDRSEKHLYKEREAIFIRNNLTVNSALQDLRTSTNESLSCQLSLAVISREGWKERGGSKIGRDLLNIEELGHYFREVEAIGNISVKMKVYYFENMSFKEQVKAIQAADMLVASHGAGLTNMFFSRNDVPILEIFPFSYYTDSFERIAKALSLPYDWIMAKPDSSTFLACIRRKAERFRNDTLASIGEEFWRTANVDTDPVLNRRLFNTAEIQDDVHIWNLRICARSQHLIFNASAVATKVVQFSNTLCRR